MRTIATPKGLGALPVGSVVLGANGVAWQLHPRGSWFSADAGESVTLHRALPAHVLYVPGEPTPSVRQAAPGLGDEEHHFRLLSGARPHFVIHEDGAVEQLVDTRPPPHA